ncbi:tRNA-specific adenosine deaminase 2-like isoform X2 [Coccinella septempunctata]|uniref:tRNA-specific adenosine deaminase 2-like isoform X2 n=1 Tax=Coccinella septempunctata TaxID=41139 RepID=UPI001D079EEA|nr:tRNA-specific adenosine deaminase 2-like isoform X2 [Coccinella septempunctata]XP_044746457.1 tRNA-specific adenosine deaminase 2-like isoform X2 [Coccinella septempunctata]
MEPLSKRIKLIEVEAISSNLHNIDQSCDTLTDIEKEYLEKAFYFANEALEAQEVPVGCLFVYQNNIIAVGRNTVNETRNATRHAEMNCIDDVFAYCKIKTLNPSLVFQEIDVYVTVEPCIMCAAALYDLKVKSVIFGCKNDRFGGETVFNVAAVLKPVTQRKGGYRADAAMDLLKKFYQGVNPNAPPSKVKVRGKKLGND